MFDSRDLQEHVNEVLPKLPRNGSSLSDDSVEANFRNRLAVAREEIWHVGGGSIHRELDCTRCNHTNDCPGDKCPRMS